MQLFKWLFNYNLSSNWTNFCICFKHIRAKIWRFRGTCGWQNWGVIHPVRSNFEVCGDGMTGAVNPFSRQHPLYKQRWWVPVDAGTGGALVQRLKIFTWNTGYHLRLRSYSTSSVDLTAKPWRECNCGNGWSFIVVLKMIKPRANAFFLTESQCKNQNKVEKLGALSSELHVLANWFLEHLIIFKKQRSFSATGKVIPFKIFKNNFLCSLQKINNHMLVTYQFCIDIYYHSKLTLQARVIWGQPALNVICKSLKTCLSPDGSIFI